MDTKGEVSPVEAEGPVPSTGMSTARNPVPHRLVCAANPGEMQLLVYLCDFLSYEICECALILSGQMVLSEASTEGNCWHKIIMGSVTVKRLDVVCS